MKAGTEEKFELSVTCFTDPLCCWSWGMQPHLDGLKEHFGRRITIKYVMGGLLPSWTNYHDQENAVSRPAQMGPVWMHAAQLMHRPINYQVWMKDPPSSSYPACIAVKSAELQSTEAGIRLFKKLQQAVMQEGRNISSGEVIKAVAGELGQELPLFDQKQFDQDLLSDRGIAAFRDDLTVIANRNITRFPTLMIESKGKRGIIVPGFRTLQSLLSTIKDAFGIYDKAEEHYIG